MFSENSHDTEYNFRPVLEFQLLYALIPFYDATCLIAGRSFTHTSRFLFVCFEGQVAPRYSQR